MGPDFPQREKKRMSDPVHTSETLPAGAPETPEPTVAEPQQSEAPAEPKPTDTVDYWKRMSRENEARAKANADAARKLKEIEDRDLSELQKAQRDREELTQRLASVEQEATRNRVALAKQLPPEIAAVLSGSTEDELAAHADALLAWRGNIPPSTPRPDPSQGPRPTNPDAEADAAYFRFFPDEAPRQRQ